MKNKKPNIKQIEEYLEKYNPLDLSGASVKLISEHNHLNYKLEKDGKAYYLRMINPETYRADEWMRISEEYTLLKHLEASRLGPEVYYLDPERFLLPLFIGEFVSDAVCFNELKPLSEEHLIGAAQAIALLNSQDITPEKFPFKEGYTRYSYLTSVKTWKKRLAIIRESEKKDILDWVQKIEKVINQAEKILQKFEPLLEKSNFAFNFGGAHCGNTYWKDNKVIFLDWQKVSYGDPAFTLARFLTSIKEKGQGISSSDKEIMLKAYLEKKQVPEFEKLLDQRLFERQIAGMVWVVWHYVKTNKDGPIERESSVSARYQTVQELLKQY